MSKLYKLGGWMQAFQSWCPTAILYAKKAPKANHVRECYKIAFEAGWHSRSERVEELETLVEMVCNADPAEILTNPKVWKPIVEYAWKLRHKWAICKKNYL